MIFSNRFEKKYFKIIFTISTAFFLFWLKKENHFFAFKNSLLFLLVKKAEISVGYAKTLAIKDMLEEMKSFFSIFGKSRFTLKKLQACIEDVARPPETFLFHLPPSVHYIKMFKSKVKCSQLFSLFSIGFNILKRFH